MIINGILIFMAVVSALIIGGGIAIVFLELDQESTWDETLHAIRQVRAAKRIK